jgi:putative peptidoglycan lipid II flippase
VKISVATVVINIGLSYLLMQFLGVGGLALGTTVALTLNFVVLTWLLERRLGAMRFGTIFGSLLRVTGVSAIMGVVIWAVDFFLSHRVGETTGGNALRVAVGLVVGAFVFLFVARLVKLPELAEITDMLRAVLKRPARGPGGTNSVE